MSNILNPNITAKELCQTDYRYNYTDDELIADWNRLLQTTEFKQGPQFKPGLKLCQHFCDNFWEIEDSKGKSFDKLWKDEEFLQSVLDWGNKSMSKLWLSWIRKAVYLRAGLPCSSMYRPHLSKQIIQIHGKKGGTLFDPCIGWGGRMLGAVAGGWDYIGCEPNKATYTNNKRIVDFISKDILVELPTIQLHNTPAEQFAYDKNVDVVLTSPPYFNLENYTKDFDQSYNKYPIYEQWRDEWLFFIMGKSIDMLRNDGLSCWNVMNIKKFDLVGDIIRFHEERGFKLVNTLGLKSPLANMRNLKNKDLTYIFSR